MFNVKTIQIRQMHISCVSNFEHLNLFGASILGFRSRLASYCQPEYIQQPEGYYPHIEDKEYEDTAERLLVEGKLDRIC